jgi:hypothetical protein
MSSPPPIHVQPLSYASEYVDTRRPGIIIAMGVLSIVFSVTFGLTALFTLMMTLGAAVGTTTATYTTNPTLTPVYPDGIGSGPRAIIVKDNPLLATFSQARRDALEGFLAQQGQQIDARLRTLTDPQVLYAMIQSSGKLDDAHDCIDFNSGRLTLEDTKAVFEPIGTADVIVVDFADTDPKPGQAGFDPEGGRGNSSMSNTATTRTSGRMAIGSTTVALQSLTGIVGGALAILLLVAGISTVRARPAGRKLHLWWAWLKILAIVFGTIATYLFWRELITQANLASGQSNAAPAAGVGIVMSAIGFVGAILYPIAVLIVMNLRSVKNYLSSVT